MLELGVCTGHNSSWYYAPIKEELAFVMFPTDGSPQSELAMTAAENTI